MRRFFAWFVVGWLCCSASIARGQSAAELRQQLEDLQRKIADAQQQEAEKVDRRSTVIGSSRTRPKEQDLGPTLVTQLYDLADLFTVAQPYVAMQPSLVGVDEEVFGSTQGTLGMPRRASSPSSMGSMGGMGGMGGGMFSIGPGSDTFGGGAGAREAEGGGGMRTTMGQLTEVIKTTIRPDEWKAGESRIAVIGASLVVTASPETHTQIAALLDLFRQRWGSLKTVSVRAWWLWLSEAELNAAIGADDKGASRKGPQGPFGTLKPDVWAKLRQASEQGERKNYSAVITCYNGQTVFTLAGDHRIAVTGLTPAFGGDDKATAVAYEPSLTTLHEGAVLQLTPLATRSGKYVVLDVHSRVNLIDKAAPAPRPEPVIPNDPRLMTSAIERPGLQSQRLSTTMRVPVEVPTLIGGMTFGTSKNQNLYLFVQGSIQDLRDDAEEAKEEAAARKPKPSLPAAASFAPESPTTSAKTSDDPAEESPRPEGKPTASKPADSKPAKPAGKSKPSKSKPE